MPQLVVGAALIQDGRLLAAQRSAPPELAGLWEFPGGKVEPGEDEREAVVRECREELGVEVAAGLLLGEVPVPIGVLRVYRAELRAGWPEPREHRALRWLTGEEVLSVPWIPVDRPLVERLAGELSGAAPERA
jgi:8-oxo-dGTP diphosphatase